MARYSAYFDESGHRNESEIMVVAGAVADVDQWAHFDREWREVLAPLGTHIFHATKFHQGSPPFDKLNSEEMDDLFAKLIGIICRRVEQTISKAVRISEFKAMNEQYVFGELYGYPYGVCARSCIGKVEAWASRHQLAVNEIEFYFEDGAKDKGQLEWIAERDSLPVPVRLPKEQHVPLQAGDLVAWCHYCHLTGGLTEKRYLQGLDKLYEQSAEWELILFPDPNRLPTILGIPERDPAFRYKSTIIKRGGKRHALVHYWPRQKHIEPKVDRKTLSIPQRKSQEEILKAAAEYDAKHPRATQGL